MVAGHNMDRSEAIIILTDELVVGSLYRPGIPPVSRFYNKQLNML